jgi:cytochrome c nitrite reductase small subunit
MKRTPRNALAAGVSSQIEPHKPQAEKALCRPSCNHFLGLRRLSLLMLRSVVLVPVAAQAQLDHSKFDPVDHYGSRFLAALIITGAALVLYHLVRYRGKPGGIASWGVLVLGAGILPVITSSAGGVLVVERSQRVGLCNSCHLAMTPYVNDMKNPKSQSLAALHYNNRYIADDQCYSCHTSYGMFGTVQAKAQGIFDVYKYYTHSFTMPLKMRHAYPNNDCLKCHAGSAKFLASHKRDREAMFADEVSCMQCHEDDNPAHNVGSN